MLLLNLSRIRVPKQHVEQTYSPDVFSNGDTFRVVSPVELGFDVVKDKDRFRLDGRVRTTLELPCSRCIERFVWPVDADFDLRYQPKASNAGQGERAIEDEDLSVAFYSDDTIDLEQLMREQFYLSLPMKPLCRVDCRGLCPQCGANLNRDRCDCAQAWEDPRFAALKALKVDGLKH